MPATVAELLAAFDARLRDRPRVPPWSGVAIERDGPLLRTHYGTRGVVESRDLGRVGPYGGRYGDLADLDALIARQVAAFERRGEPATWRVYTHDAESRLGARLLAAGFAPDTERAVLAAEPTRHGGSDIATLDPDRVRSWCDTDSGGGAAAGPPYWRSMAMDSHAEAPPLGADWARRLDDAGFAALSDRREPRPAVARELTGWTNQPTSWGVERAVVTEAAGALRADLRRLGFRELTRVTAYRWGVRGVEPLPVTSLDSPEYDGVWGAFEGFFGFRSGSRAVPGMTEPDASVAWSMGAAIGNPDVAARVRALVERGLRARTPQGGRLYRLDWQHPSHCFDPHHVGGADRPPWPGDVFYDGAYYVHLSPDLRFGTFGHPWDASLCVFGADLLAEIEDELTALLGTVLRRGGRNVANRWIYDS